MQISVKNGFAFIEFTNTKDAETACADMNGASFLGER
jgi:RNA recognition motif-containing protein